MTKLIKSILLLTILCACNSNYSTEKHQDHSKDSSYSHFGLDENGKIKNYFLDSKTKKILYDGGWDTTKKALDEKYLGKDPATVR